MKGRVWLIVGAALGVAIAAGHVPYLAGAGHSLANTALRLVGSGADRVVRAVATAGAPRRLVLGLGGVVAAVLPGLTALLLVLAARGTARLRSIVAVLVVALGGASYVYQPHGTATGALLLALAVASAAVLLSGPLVIAPMAALAGLIGGEYLPRLVESGQKVTQRSVSDLHQAIFNSAGNPKALQVAMLLIAAVPFAFAARLIVAR